jgi:hypothetical protein
MALPNNNISAGAPPILWSTIKEALDKINDNFIALDLATGGTAVDLSALPTDVSPGTTGAYTLGTNTRRWKSLHTSPWGSSPSESNNGIWVGDAQIRGMPGTGDPYFPNTVIDLPLNSTVNGALIIDPNKYFFKDIEVDDGKRLVPTAYGSLLTFTSGTGMNLVVNSAADEITFNLDPNFNLIGNVLAANGSTILVNSTTGKITGDVGVTTDWKITANSNEWKFGTDGKLTFPGAVGTRATFGYTSPNDVLSTVNNLVIASNESVRIKADNDVAAPTWIFGSDASLTAPGAISLGYLGTATYSLAASGTGGRLDGQPNKTFKIILDNSVTKPEWTYNTDGSLTLPTLGKLINTGNEWSFGSTGILTLAGQARFPDTQAAPTSDGSTARIRLYKGAATYSYGIGSETDYMWFNIDNNAQGFKFYKGGTEILRIGSTGITGSINGSLTGDIKGSVFGDDSTILVDGTGSRIVGNVYNSVVSTAQLRTSETQLRLGYRAGLTSQGASSVAIGNNAGTTTQGASSVTIGNNAGTTTQGADSVAIGNAAGNLGQGTRSIAIGSSAGANSQSANAIAIGYTAGGLSQGEYAVAIGVDAGSSNQPANTIILNASGSAVNGVSAQTSSFYVAPIRNAAGTSGVLQYNSTTKEVSYSTALGTVSGTFSGPLTGNVTGSVTGNIFTTLIDSADSSAITVTPAVIFSADVTVENDLTVTNKVTAKEFVSTGVGDPTIESSGNINLTAATAVIVNSSPFRMASFTSTQRDALTPVNGDVIYNITTGKFQGRAAGAWVDLH